MHGSSHPGPSRPSLGTHLTPCFTPPVSDRQLEHPNWQPARVQLHPNRLHIRLDVPKPPTQRRRLERLEPVPPDLPPPRPVHEIVQGLARHFDACVGRVGALRLSKHHSAAELRTALTYAREAAKSWVRLCNQLCIDHPDAMTSVQKVLNFLQARLEEVQHHAGALAGFKEARSDLQAAQQAIMALQDQASRMPAYTTSVWPADGSWDRQPPSVADVLMMMQAPAQDLSTVRARLEDGQRPMDIASTPSPVKLDDMQQLQGHLAQQLGKPDLGLPMTELQVLLAGPTLPIDAIAQGLLLGLSATETRALFEAGVPIHPHTAPDRQLRQQLQQLKPVPVQQVGQGMVNNVHLHRWTDGVQTWSYTWRPERPDAEADAMTDCGIPMRAATEWDRPGPNLTGRQVLTSLLAERLQLERHITVAKSWPAVIDSTYGSLNEFVPGLQKLLVHSPHDMALDNDDLQWLRSWAEGPTLLADIARWQGLTRLELTATGLRAEKCVPQPGGATFHLPMVRPLDVKQPQVRCQMVVAVWFHLLTGQVDWNAGNVAFAPDPTVPEQHRLVLFDNDLAFGRFLMHPEDACNPLRHQPDGPRVRPPRSALHGTRIPPVIPADLAESLLAVTARDLLDCGGAGLISLPEFTALHSRLRHLQARVRELRQDPHGWLRTDGDWLTPETTRRLGLDDLPALADEVARTVLQPPGRRVDDTLLREIESSSLLRALAVAQEVARRHPQQDWFPTLLDETAIRSAVHQARTFQGGSGSLTAEIMNS